MILAQQLIERGLAAGASAADASYGGHRSLGVEVRHGALEDVSRSESESVNLRLFDGQRSASVATNDVSEESIGRLVDRAMASGTREELVVHVTATVPSKLGAEPVARFEMTLSIKKR